MAKKQPARGFGLMKKDQIQPDPPKPQRISATTVDALSKLHDAIAQAEKHLKKMPGTTHPSVEIDVSDVLCDPDDPVMADILKFKDDRIIVERWDYDPEYETQRCMKRTTLDQYQVDTRRAFAKHIPELIKLAKAAEDLVANELNEVTNSILEAMAATLEVHDES